ncbi:amino acid ABC transporter ATP-binding protein [Heyndrickxia coagulans]|uniref:Polar amino acid transport system ATP-binding protein n=1 Tax=Heyndrickxia coagulans DSM 1 = ATCC 7050 TaxID=1121088 RepID=A0A8B4BYC4_HEYCO|nr:amino acid ABC transporter ATP-binding protein [Heyndrickxia coagulans]AJH79204.1 ABC transporter family protein [Heyndrickxia coagulans DSM 1 = ATCC 7050]MCR2847742.1 amino acid ABC transporter ATP-binding protein [Heyndrickxia coagulans]MDR4225459.1 amino acid ABC transporter ATP-binding protein [Heyndrickxia coagulans DSM 1 = ATCC 7050]MED4493775.1 amino acid ABC transporter ATP-binding protein [Heyndrickxia coagulans]MED4537630.1 amino acid ABC transporter ATP-binding protein [Heyndrick
MAEPLLKVEHLKKSYGEKQVLEDISFEVEEGSVVVLLGPSGSGKSTLIRCLNGLEAFQGGTILFNGETVRPSSKNWRRLRQQIGMVFQSYDLFPNMTVLENILLGAVKVQKRKKDEAARQAMGLLKEVGMEQYANAYPRQLSGGQKQRVAIVRALELNPKLMLFDEVTASLDPEMVRGVLEIILRLAREKMTMIVVTHEMNFARKIGDKILFLEDGKILEETPGRQFFTKPQTERAKNFLESMDF